MYLEGMNLELHCSSISRQLGSAATCRVAVHMQALQSSPQIAVCIVWDVSNGVVAR